MNFETATQKTAISKTSPPTVSTSTVLPHSKRRHGGEFRRWPALCVIVVLLVLMGIVDVTDSANSSSQTTSNSTSVVFGSSDSLLQDISEPDLTSQAVTWYCPVGWISPSRGVTSELIVVNSQETSIGMWVSFFPSRFEEGLEGRTVATQGYVLRVEVPAFTSERVAIPESIIASEETLATTSTETLDETFDEPPAETPGAGNAGNSAVSNRPLDEIFISALVELDTPGASVSQVVVDSSGRSLSQCVQDVSNQWYFAGGTTTIDARYILSLFNPFSEAAVVDVTFATDTGRLAPTTYSGLIVAARSSLFLEVGTEVVRRAQVATSVNIRTGHLVAAQLQTFDGSAGLAGTNILVGSAGVSKQWIFPYESGEGEPTAYLIYNPGDSEARVEVDFRLDFGSELPAELLVPAGQRVVLAINVDQAASPLPFYLPTEQEAVPVTLEGVHWAVVRSLTEVGVVAEQLWGGGELLTAPTQPTQPTQRPASDPELEELAEGELLDQELADDELADDELAGDGLPDSEQTDSEQTDSEEPDSEEPADTATDESEEPDTSTTDESEEPTIINTPVAEVTEPAPIYKSAYQKAGLTHAATSHVAFAQIADGVFLPEVSDSPDGILSESVAIANTSNATISRVIVGEERYELAPRRRILLNIQGIEVVQASTPVVVAPGYAVSEFRTVPEVFSN